MMSLVWWGVILLTVEILAVLHYFYYMYLGALGRLSGYKVGT